MKEALVGSLTPTADWLEAQRGQVPGCCSQKCFFRLSASLPTELASSPGNKDGLQQHLLTSQPQRRGQLFSHPSPNLGIISLWHLGRVAIYGPLTVTDE